MATSSITPPATPSDATTETSAGTSAASAKPAHEGKSRSHLFPVLTLAIAVVVAVLVALGCAGGAVWFLVRSGRLHVPVLVGAGSVVASEPKAEPIRPRPTHVVNLEPILANLADPGGSAYLRLGLTLRVEDAATPKGKEDKPEKEAKAEKEPKGMSDSEAGVRDAVLGVLGAETSETLLSAGGKERLKSEIREALGKQVPALQVRDVLFSEFLVQR